MFMSGRTFAIGDVHGETAHLVRVLAQLPELTWEDTLVFLGDYVDRGPDSRGVVELLMGLPERTLAKVVCLRGNHEDAWLRVRQEGWDAFVFPAEHGCLATVRSFIGGAVPLAGELPRHSERALMTSGIFFPPPV